MWLFLSHAVVTLLLKNSKDHPIYGGGFAAVARLQIIAAQELGHFADIKRDIKAGKSPAFG